MDSETQGFAYLQKGEVKMNERIEVSEVQSIGSVAVSISVVIQYEDFNADEAMERLFSICDKLGLSGFGDNRDN